MSVIRLQPPSVRSLDVGLRRELIAATALDRAASQECWLRAKERQGHPVEAAQLSRLEDAPTTWPGAQRAFEAPMVAGHQMTELEAAIASAGPAITRAVRRARGAGRAAG